MNWPEAVVLGLVQGITEFLPVSSSGHLVLFQNWLQVEGVNGLAYTAVLHFATVLAVITYFWSDIWSLMQTGLRKLGRLPVNQKDLTLLYALIVATIPAAVAGLVLETVVDRYLSVPWVVASFLFLSAVFFMYAEWRYYLCPREKELTVKRGLLIGVFQAVAIIPGVSRSGSTIAGGMLLGMTRYESTRFSFLLAVPITLAAGAKKLLDLLQESGQVDWFMILVGAGVAYLTAILVIHFFLRFIRRYTLWPFVWYSMVLSGLVVYVYLFA